MRHDKEFIEHHDNKIFFLLGGREKGVHRELSKDCWIIL